MYVLTFLCWRFLFGWCCTCVHGLKTVPPTSMSFFVKAYGGLSGVPQLIGELDEGDFTTLDLGWGWLRMFSSETSVTRPLNSNGGTLKKTNFQNYLNIYESAKDSLQFHAWPWLITLAELKWKTSFHALSFFQTLF